MGLFLDSCRLLEGRQHLQAYLFGGGGGGADVEIHTGAARNMFQQIGSCFEKCPGLREGTDDFKTIKQKKTMKRKRQNETGTHVTKKQTTTIHVRNPWDQKIKRWGRRVTREKYASEALCAMNRADIFCTPYRPTPSGHPRRGREGRTSHRDTTTSQKQANEGSLPKMFRELVHTWPFPVYSRPSGSR